VYELRGATDADREWLYELNRAAVREYVAATWGIWDEQFQRQRFSELFSAERFQVIRQDGVDIGVLEVRREAHRLYLGEIALLPEHQSNGIGTEVISDLVAEADAALLPVELQVLKVNPARRLYERLGFEVVGQTETHFQMRRMPGGAEPPS
jgi:ribosomal protein S18 acetylase RimI-like enzyme